MISIARNIATGMTDDPRPRDMYYSPSGWIPSWYLVNIYIVVIRDKSVLA
jgi:hypothetical protein